MRLDKYLGECGVCSRSEAARAAKGGSVTVNGAVQRSVSVHIDEQADVVTFYGKTVTWRRFSYLMLNKPAGYISSTEKSEDTVMTLLPPEFARNGFFPCGRLDRDTMGLLLITNDGQTAHKLLSPKKHVAKTYRYEITLPLTQEGRMKLEQGVDIGGYTTGEARIVPQDDTHGEITIAEGKFHQIKRMFHAVGTEICRLERIAFGALTLDSSLKRGEWRELTAEEIRSIGGEDS